MLRRLRIQKLQALARPPLALCKCSCVAWLDSLTPGCTYNCKLRAGLLQLFVQVVSPGYVSCNNMTATRWLLCFCLFNLLRLGIPKRLSHVTGLMANYRVRGSPWRRIASAYDALVRSLIGAGVPKLLILCMLMVSSPQFQRSRIWNTELPIAPKWDVLDLFSGKGSVKASCV